jgi:site-specific DNA recombinase
MRVAIYVRVSTRNQVHTQTIEQQIERLHAFITAQGWELPEENIFRDDGYSGASLKRPGLDRLRDGAALARFDRILIMDPDRLARNYVHQVLLLEELQRHGCQVEFLDRPMSQDPHDQLLLQIRGAVAEYERTLIAERMRRGRMAKLQTGQMLPWTRPPYGYRVHPERPRDPAGVRLDPAEAAVVGEIFAWYVQEGSSLLGLAKHLYEQGIPSPTGKSRWGVATLRGILTNPTYTGQLYAFRTTYRPPRIRRSATRPIGHPHGTAMPVPPAEWIRVATVPAIVSEEQFQLAAAKLAHNQSFAQRNNRVQPYLLRRLVSCGECGLSCLARRMVPHHYTYYICSGKARAVQRPHAEHCASRFIPAGQLDELVWKDLCALLLHPEVITQALRRAHDGAWLPQELQARRDNVRRGKTSLQHQLDRLTEAYLSGVIPLPEYQRRRAELEERQQGLTRQEEQLQAQANRANEAAKLVASVEAFCQRVQSGLAAATFEQKRQLVELLVDRVIVAGEAVEIRYVIPTSQQREHIRFCHLRSDYFAHPRLIEPCQLLPPRVCQQVRIDPIAVFAVGRLHPAPPQLAQQALFPHQAQHPLVIDRPAVPVPLRCHPAIAVTREPQHNPLDRLPQRRSAPLLAGRGRRRLGHRRQGGDAIVAAAVHLQQIARPRGRQRGKARLGLLNQRPFRSGLKPPFCAVLSAWRRNSFSKVARPKAASSWAMRASAFCRAGSSASGSSQAFSPRNSYCSRQRRTSVSHRRCSRQSWERRFSPLIHWRTTPSLNSRLKTRFFIGVLPSDSSSASTATTLFNGARSLYSDVCLSLGVHHRPTPSTPTVFHTKNGRG